MFHDAHAAYPGIGRRGSDFKGSTLAGTVLTEARLEGVGEALDRLPKRTRPEPVWILSRYEEVLARAAAERPTHPALIFFLEGTDYQQNVVFSYRDWFGRMTRRSWSIRTSNTSVKGYSSEVCCDEEMFMVSMDL